MKVIISHDIDHFTWGEHVFKDLFIPKYIAKHLFYFSTGKIPFSLLKLRIAAFASKRVNRLEELIAFNKQQQVPASFFIGVRNGLSLSYSLDVARSIAKYIIAKNSPIYLHGIAFNDFSKMKSERDDLENIIGGAFPLGIRMHYLRNDFSTLINLEKLGYEFDSTLYSLANPYRIGRMIEFPVSMMEVYEMSYTDSNLELVKKRSLARLQQAKDIALKYFTVIFHDNHFSDSFPLHKEWYKWLIQHLKSEGHEFIDFRTAIGEMAASGLK